jgi:hypothetical protein
MMMTAGIKGSVKSSSGPSSTPNGTNVNSSIIHELEGLPKRLNGKTKYQEEIDKILKRIKIILILRSLFALLTVSLMQF